MFRKKKNPDGTPRKKKSLLRRILKWTGISFLVLLVLAILLPIIFQKQIFEFVKKEINKNLNAEFKCDDYSLTLISTFPNFTLELKDVSLTGIKEFKGVKLFGAKSLLVTLDIKSVLFGDKYDIKKIGLVDADIYALVLENGKANWDIAKPSEEKTPEEKADTTSKFAMELEHYYLESTNVTYEDRAGGTYLNIVNLDHDGKGDFTADQTLLETTTKADAITLSQGGIPYMKKTKADITMNIDMDMKNSKYTFKENSVKLNEFKMDFDGWLAMKNDMDMDIKFKSNENTFASILSMIPGAYTKDFSQVKVTGSTKFDGFVKGVMSDKSMPAFAVNLDINNASFHYPGMPQSATGIFVKGSARANGDPSMDDMVIDIPKIAMSLGGNPLSAFFHMNHPMTDPGLDAGLKTDLDLARLKEVLPMGEGESYAGHIKADVEVKGKMSALAREDYENFTAKGDVIAQQVVYKSKDMGYDTKINAAEVKFNPKAMELTNFDAEVGKTQLLAKGNLENYLAYTFKGETIKGQLDLNSPLVDLKEMMGPSTAAPATGSNTNTTAAAPATATSESYVFEVPKNIDFVLNTAFGKVIYPAMSDKNPDLVLDNVSGGIVIHEAVMSFNNLKMNTLGGNVVLGGSYSTVNIAEPEVKLNYNIQDLDIKQTAQTFNMVEKLAPIASKCTGRFSSVMNFNSKLDQQMAPVYNTLNGDGYVASKNIYVEGFEPLNKLAKELKIEKLAKQNIQDVKVFFEFREGKVWVKPYDIKLGPAKANIQGTTAFTSEIDYDVTMSMPRSEFGGQANSILNGLVDKAKKSGADVKLGDNVNLKVKVTGTVSDPKIKTNLKEQLNDVKEDIKEEVKEKVKEKVEEVKEDAKAKARAEADKILADAQAQADKIKAEAKKAADNIRTEAKKAGDKLVEEAGGNPLKKAAAKKLAEKGQKEADEKAQKLENEANAKADKIMADARAKADEKLK